jgi:hypothetical protein
MWTLARKGKKFGYCTTSKEGIEKYREWYIDDHVVSESAQIQQRLWDTSKKTLLASEAEQVARDTLEEQITVMELS